MQLEAFKLGIYISINCFVNVIASHVTVHLNFSYNTCRLQVASQKLSHLLLMI